MRNRVLLPLRLKADYGMKRLSFFYPELYPNDKITYRDVINLYEECLHYRDVDAINLLNNNFDLEHIFAFDYRFQSEETVRGCHRKSDYDSKRKRQRNDRIGKKRLYGGTYFRKIFSIDNNGNHYFDIRKFYFSRSCQDIQTMFDLSESKKRYIVDGIAFSNMYEDFRNLPDLKKVILFYLRHIASRNIPILDYEELRDGIIKMK